jgi:outer membrane biosynthesis protein TonB
MNTPEASADDLIFGWERPGRGKWTIAGFLFGSLVVHALGFYLFQIVYPPAVALLPPPGRVSLIAPSSDEGRLLLGWLEAEDPALASTTQPLPDGKSLVMPTIQHAPSYLTRQPALKELPPAPPPLHIPSARPPAPVEPPATRTERTPKVAATMIRFSPELEMRGAAQLPELKFNASSLESPQVAGFRIAVDGKGAVRHCFLQSSSGDAILDEQARKYLALCRFSPIENRQPEIDNDLTWGTASLEWGNDLVLPSPANPGPTAP